MASTNIYSLTEYQVNISLPEKMASLIKQNEISLGGSGSYLESIEIRLNSDTWTVKGDSTGSYIHTLNADRTGSFSLTLNQVSSTSKLLYFLFNVYFEKIDENAPYLNLYPFSLITVKNLKTGQIVATMTDSFIKKIPDKKYGAEAQTETWEFNCGIVQIKGENII